MNEELSIVRPVKKRMRFKSVLRANKWLTPTVKQFTFSAPSEFDFYSGQYMNMRFKIAEKVVARSYSISSLPGALSDSDEKYLCFTIKNVAGGEVTPALFTWEVGTEVSLQGPFGTFFIGERVPEADIVMIGTGTGLAPLKSMLGYLLESCHFKRKVTLIMGVRFETELLYMELWKEYEERFSNFQVLTAVSAAKSPAYLGVHGRVNVILESNIEHYRTRMFYICGLQAMVNGVATYLRNEGIAAEHIFYEKYDS
ncbi:hypothetical protein COTS27_00891 [Spirochaetota bacterium]|nr:hypothetical protein COTS27_00891 [Spirochaetota bacterium]